MRTGRSLTSTRASPWIAAWTVDGRGTIARGSNLIVEVSEVIWRLVIAALTGIVLFFTPAAIAAFIHVSRGPESAERAFARVTQILVSRPSIIILLILLIALFKC